jgi:hypothetical protein
VGLKSDLKFGAFGGAQMNGCRNLEMKTFFFGGLHHFPAKLQKDKLF